MVVDSAVPRVVHFCASLGMPRRWSQALQTAPSATSRQALLCSASRDRALVCSGSSCFRFGLKAAVPPKLCLRVRTTLAPAPVPAAYGCVPRGQWAPLDEGMFALIDRSSLLLAEPFCCHPCSRKPAPSTSSAVSGRCSRKNPSRGLEEGLVLPSCSSRAALLSQRVVASQYLCTLSP